MSNYQNQLCDNLLIKIYSIMTFGLIGLKTEFKGLLIKKFINFENINFYSSFAFASL